MQSHISCKIFYENEKIIGDMNMKCKRHKWSEPYDIEYKNLIQQKFYTTCSWDYLTVPTFDMELKIKRCEKCGITKPLEFKIEQGSRRLVKMDEDKFIKHEFKW